MIQRPNGSLSDRGIRTRMHADINQRETRSRAVRLNGNEVLISFGPHLQLHTIPAIAIVTRDGLRHFVVAWVVSVTSIPAAMTLDRLSISLQVFVVESDNLVGSII